MADLALPWLAQQTTYVNTQLASQRLPHALLVAGLPGLGKQRLVTWMARRLLCEATASPCDQCRSCELLDAGTHPDLYTLGPADSRQIVMDQLRDMLSWATQTASRGGNKVVLIRPADALNINAANALLKVLEEPRNGTYFFLQSDMPERLMPTIRSRCQRLDVNRPDPEMASAWLVAEGVAPQAADILLRVTGGLPLLAYEHAMGGFLDVRQVFSETMSAMIGGQVSPVQAASKLLDRDAPVDVYNWLYGALADALKLGLAHGDAELVNPDLVVLVQQLAATRPLSALAALSERAVEARRLLLGVNNPNPQLLLEGVLVDIAQAVRQNRTSGAQR